jgi:hypothetical protein
MCDCERRKSMLLDPIPLIVPGPCGKCVSLRNAFVRRLNYSPEPMAEIVLNDVVLEDLGFVILRLRSKTPEVVKEDIKYARRGLRSHGKCRTRNGLTYLALPELSYNA